MNVYLAILFVVVALVAIYTAITPVEDDEPWVEPRPWRYDDPDEALEKAQWPWGDH